MAKKIITVTAAFFLLLGIILLIVPQISNQIGKENAHVVIEKFEEIKQNTDQTFSQEQPDKENKGEIQKKSISKSNKNKTAQVYYIDADRLYRDSVTYNNNLKFNQYKLLINEDSYRQMSLNLFDYGVPNNVYGYISAPSIDMELPIYLGATEENMAFGTAHLTYTSLPIGGESTNCVLAAHTGYIGRIFFDYIRYLNVGDEITVTNLWNKLTYRVTDKRVFKKYESANCYIKEGQDLLTLITCANGGADRYYVLCERSLH